MQSHDRKNRSKPVESKAAGWHRCRLGNILRRHNEIIHPGDRTEGEARFVGLEHIEPHTGRRIGSSIIQWGNLTGRKPTFRAGQIVYGYLRPYLNKVWVAEFDGCSSVDQFAFEVDQEVADTQYIAAFMRSESFLRRSSDVTTPGQLPRISIEEIEAVELDLPPLAEQARIVARLTQALATVDAARRAAQDRLAAAVALPAAYLCEAFEGPAVRGEQAWPMVRLGNHVSKIGSGLTPMGGHVTYRDEGIPLIRSQNVHMNRFCEDGLAFISAEQDNVMTGSRVQEHDVLLNITGASIGRVCVVPQSRVPANVNQHVCIIRSDGSWNPDFLCQYLASPLFQRIILEDQPGATRQALTKEQIEDFLIPLPPLVEQRRIAQRMRQAFAAVDIVRCVAQEGLAAVEALPASFLREAFDSRGLGNCSACSPPHCS